MSCARVKTPFMPRTSASRAHNNPRKLTIQSLQVINVYEVPESVEEWRGLCTVYRRAITAPGVRPHSSLGGADGFVEFYVMHEQPEECIDILRRFLVDMHSLGKRLSVKLVFYGRASEDFMTREMASALCLHWKTVLVAEVDDAELLRWAAPMKQKHKVAVKHA